MRLLAIITTFFIPLVYSQSERSEITKGWHQKVGIKNAEAIRRSEEQQISQRIVGGFVAPINFHPYLAGLLIDVIGLSSPSACGGSILTPSRILTAAHCWFDGRFQAVRIQVVLGTPFLFHGGLRTHVQALALHPQYNFETFAHDIAVLYLPVIIRYSDSIQPITLPYGDLLTADFTGMTAVAAGYGRYSDHSNPTTNTMTRNVFLDILPLNKCRVYYGDMVLDSNICTCGKGGVGICQGDSGGPLTIRHRGQQVLIGVSSFVALDGCELGFPSAFARVSSYLPWIRLHM